MNQDRIRRWHPGTSTAGRMPTFRKPHDQANRIRQTARQARVCRRTLPKREMDLSKREMSASYPENSRSTVAVPHLRYFRAGPRFDLWREHRAKLLGRMEWPGRLRRLSKCRWAWKSTCTPARRASRPHQNGLPGSLGNRCLGPWQTPSQRLQIVGPPSARYFGRQANRHMAIRFGRAVTGGRPAMSWRISNIPIRRCDLSQPAAALW